MSEEKRMSTTMLIVSVTVFALIGTFFTALWLYVAIGTSMNITGTIMGITAPILMCSVGVGLGVSRYLKDNKDVKANE